MRCSQTLPVTHGRHDPTSSTSASSPCLFRWLCVPFHLFWRLLVVFRRLERPASGGAACSRLCSRACSSSACTMQSPCPATLPFSVLFCPFLTCPVRRAVEVPCEWLEFLLLFLTFICSVSSSRFRCLSLLSCDPLLPWKTLLAMPGVCLAPFSDLKLHAPRIFVRCVVFLLMLFLIFTYEAFTVFWPVFCGRFLSSCDPRIFAISLPSKRYLKMP